MPVHKTTGKGGRKDCYKWGTSGKTYCGKGAKQKALKQQAAIYSSGYKGK